MSVFEDSVKVKRLYELVNNSCSSSQKQAICSGFLHTLYNPISTQQYVGYLKSPAFTHQNDFIFFYDVINNALVLRFQDRVNKTLINEQWTLKRGQSFLYEHVGTKLSYTIDKAMVARDDEATDWFKQVSKLTAYGYWYIDKSLGYIMIGCRPHTKCITNEDTIANWVQDNAQLEKDYFLSVLTTNTSPFYYSANTLDRFIQRFQLTDNRCLSINNLRYTIVPPGELWQQQQHAASPTI